MSFDTIVTDEEARRYTDAGWWSDRTILDDLAWNVAERPDAEAIIDRDRRITFAEYQATVDRLAGAFLDLGIAKGEIVSYQLPNWAEANFIDLALLAIGAVPNPIMYVYRERELSYILAKTRSRLFITPDHFRGHDYAKMALTLRDAHPDVEHLFVVGDDVPAGSRPFSDLLAQPFEDRYSRADLTDRKPTGYDVALVMFTSGTTSDPKGVMHTHNSLRHGARVLQERTKVEPGDPVMTVGPVGNSTGSIAGVWLHLPMGAKVVWLDVWDPEQAARLIQDERVVMVMPTPTPFPMGVIRLPGRDSYDLSSLRTWTSGGAPIPRELIAEADDAGFMLQAIYGSTECLWYCMHRFDDPPEKLTSTDGAPVEGMEVRVVDVDGNEVEPGTPGEVLVRGPMRCAGYFEMPDVTASAFDADGWWHSGDIVSADADGYVKAVDRKKDMIIRKGMKIFPAEIEVLVFRHPSVAQAAVVGFPDADAGERACLFVVTTAGQTPLTMEEMQAHLRAEGVATYKWPERIEHVDALPMTASGKVQRFALRELLVGART
jgi:non-ribosomal peptide synthetase component E (peptide arylation enzyme)